MRIKLVFAAAFLTSTVILIEHCQNCHAADGGGLGALIPPLNDTVFLRARRPELACMIRNGIRGKITVNGKEYEGVMPANNDLTPIDLAEIVTYVSNSFGNKQGLYDVTRSQSDCP